MLDVIAIGELLVDFTPAGRTAEHNELFECHPGGAPANVVTALSRLGVSTGLISKVGGDPFGSLLHRRLLDVGVDVSEVSFTDEASTTLAFVHLEDQGNRSFSFFRKPGADTFLKVEDISLERIQQCKVLHFGSVSLTHEPARSATQTAVIQAKEAGVLLSFDPNLRMSLWESEEEARQQILWGMNYADVLKISEEELYFICNTNDIEKGSLELQRQFNIPLIVVTLAEKGCYYRLAHLEGYVEGFQVDTIDTTGAGDAFLGCLLYHILKSEYALEHVTTQQMISMLTFANAGGALVTTRKGALEAMPTIDEIEQFMKLNQQHTTDVFRPGFHFAPAANWANDPNGLVYYEGMYHLFYQYHPYSTIWGPMHWGHAVSKDLIQWQHMPVALFPDEHGAIFSGCCVVDWNNSSGLFEDSHGLIAIFTHADTHPDTDQSRQRQSLAYSSDQGHTWHKYAGNPVITEKELIDFRDPKVFWHSQSAHWIMVIVAGDHARFYKSRNLLDWSFTGTFGEGQGSHDGVWECPDLFELPVDDAGYSKWVLIISIGDHPECPEGSRTQYFVGDFDGHTFTNDHPQDHIMWLDYGRDNYAGVTWSDIPEQDGRRVIIGWMSNWKYANNTPTDLWRGAMTLPRALYLTSNNGHTTLIQMPVQEVQQLREQSRYWENVCITPATPFVQPTHSDLIEIDVEIDVRLQDEVHIILKSSQQSEVIVGYDPVQQWLFIDRSRSGITDFHPLFAVKHGVNLAIENGQLHLHLWVDRNSIEVYANQGIVALTDQIFPDAPLDSIEISTKSGQTTIHSLQLHTLKSIAIQDATVRGADT